MSLIVTMRRQNAIWWERNPTPDKFGKYSFLAPVEVKCRWDDAAKEFVSSRLEKAVSRSLVYVDRVMVPGDYLKLGRIDPTPFDGIDAFSAFRASELCLDGDGEEVDTVGAEVHTWGDQLNGNDLLIVDEAAPGVIAESEDFPAVRNPVQSYYSGPGPAAGVERTIVAFVRQTVLPEGPSGFPFLLFGKSWGISILDVGGALRWGLNTLEIDSVYSNVAPTTEWTVLSAVLTEDGYAILRVNGEQVLSTYVGFDEITDPSESQTRLNLTQDSFPMDYGAFIFYERALTTNQLEEAEEIVRHPALPEEDPRDDASAFEIRRFDQNPNFRHSDSLKTAYL